MFPAPRFARLNSAWLCFLGSIVVFAGLVFALAHDSAWFGRDEEPTDHLTLFCAAGIKAPVSAVAAEYEKEFGVQVRIQYGGSETLLSKIDELKATGRVDLYLPADDSYVDLARRKRLVAEVLPLATMRPVLAVKKGNPARLRSLDDALAPGRRLSHANPGAAAVGKVAKEALEDAGLWDAFAKNVKVTKMTVNDVAIDITTGAVDAGVVWDSTVAQTPELQVVPVPLFARIKAGLSICVTSQCRRPTAALGFARYLAARDRGLPAFKKFGFAPVAGDPWARTPKLRLLAGAMLRPAIEKTITAFEEREGVRVTRVYNGCGILVAQMHAGTRPDAFFACDKDFMNQVSDLFLPPTTVSSNQLVILVRKGNPHKIESLKDLGKPGLRVGIGHEKQCAMGVLTQQTLKQDRSTKRVMR